MGARGGNAPTGRVRREAHTHFLRAPYQDWAALSQGYKTEFRTPPKGMTFLDAPTPVVLYAVSPQLKRRYEKLMVLAAHHTERLSDIGQDPAALMREGYATYKEFRSYWRKRTRREYRPLAQVEVFRLSPWLPNDTVRLGARICEHLYGEFMLPEVPS